MRRRAKSEIPWSEPKTLSAALSVNNTFQWLIVDAKMPQGVSRFGGGTASRWRLVFLSDGQLCCQKRSENGNVGNRSCPFCCLSLIAMGITALQSKMPAKGLLQCTSSMSVRFLSQLLLTFRNTDNANSQLCQCDPAMQWAVVWGVAPPSL